MLFNSYIFIFVFLPVMLLLWFGLNHLKKFRTAQIILIIMSLWFYGYGNYWYILLIVSSILLNWLFSRYMDFAPKVLGIAGIICDLAILFYFKYCNFFIDNINFIFHTKWEMQKIVLPLGISFYTFQQISYMADRMKGEAEHYTLVDYAAYVVYFPQLIAGPIVSHDVLIPQFMDKTKKKINWDNMLKGIRLFTIGLGKKVLLADMIAKIADAGFGMVDRLDMPAAWITILAYTFQIYFDFSGYCDMALGAGWMMNIELPQNFKSPYKSLSIAEFWRRWHITLGTFLRKYIYIPLGGNRKGKWKHIRNILFVFLCSGIWHGANWTFIIWGLGHGVMNLLERNPLIANRKKGIKWGITFVYVMLMWILFRSDSLAAAGLFYKKLFSFQITAGSVMQLANAMGGWQTYILYIITNHFFGNEAIRWLYLLCMTFMLVIAAWLCTRKDSVSYVKEHPATKAEMCVLAFIMTASVLTFSGITVFLYFNF